LSNFDILFISYKESNADKNWLELKSRFSQAKRVHGISGIANAHVEAAKKSSSHYFFVVDGDNRIRQDFKFSVNDLKLAEDTIYVWRSFNPINHLIYGYGAIKLYNKSLLNEAKKNYVDLAMTVASKYKIINELASDTYFFNTPEEAWRGAFRECAKLTVELNGKSPTEETKKRLNQWKEIKSKHINAEWVLKGVESGIHFAQKNFDKIYLLNDFNWLQKEFSKYE
jgi:hypothetical protein